MLITRPDQSVESGDQRVRERISRCVRPGPVVGRGGARVVAGMDLAELLATLVRAGAFEADTALAARPR